MFSKSQQHISLYAFEGVKFVKWIEGIFSSYSANAIPGDRNKNGDAAVSVSKAG